MNEDSRTFLEISGYPHYEKVCSNFLEFFFDPTKPHKLGTLFLAALLKEDRLHFGRVSIEREVVIPSSKKRIDLLISCESHLVVIENKIFHKANNPFAEYATYAHERAAEGQIVKKFLLILNDTEDTNARNHGFCTITWDAFLEEVEQRLEEYSGRDDDRYRVLLFEFLKTMHNLHKAPSTMNPEHLKFFREAYDKIDELLESVREFKKELNRRVWDLAELIDIKGLSNVSQSTWNKEPGVYDILLHNIELRAGAKVTIDAKITARGWEISVPPSSVTNPLKNLLMELGIVFKDGDRLILSEQFGYDEPLPNVQAVLQPIIDKIAHS